ncbi:MAG TPA: N-acetyltransferase [Caulobacteraceae bacterium]|nr:N-acetyltransferase [Caulobacteraceae bacterium]
MSLAAASALPPIAAERREDAPCVERLILRVLGPGRLAKSAERLREGRAPLLQLSFVAWSGAEAVGCVRQWAVSIGGRAAILLGPFAVDPAWRGQGVGAALIGRACEGARDAGHALILLVGDEPYYGPLGFSAPPAARVLMPGPVDQRRVLVRALAPGADADLGGAVTPA